MLTISTKIKVLRHFPQNLHLFDAGLSVTHTETSQRVLGISLSYPPFASPEHILTTYSITLLPAMISL